LTGSSADKLLIQRRTIMTVSSHSLASKLAEIIQRPEDDTLRLEYADELAAQGDAARAEFVRLQLQLASASRDDPGWEEWEDRVEELKRQHEERWTAGFTGRGISAVIFERGFIEYISTTALLFIRQGSTWADKTPLRGVSLRKVVGRGPRLGLCPHLLNITNMSLIDNHTRDADVIPIVRSPYARLRHLSIRGHAALSETTHVGNATLAALKEAVFFRLLEELVIRSDGSLGSAGVQALVAGDGPISMKRLVIQVGCIDDDGAMALASSSQFGGLVDLWLDGHEITDGGLVALLTSPSLTHLATLSVAGNQVSAAALNVLAAQQLCPALESLHLAGNDLDGIDVDAVGVLLHNNPKLWLGLRRCSISVPAQRALLTKFPGQVAVDVELPRRTRTKVYA
jgi:uncharacterized protein (TIGR02996 family)